jgi:hypothetical protein
MLGNVYKVLEMTIILGTSIHVEHCSQDSNTCQHQTARHHDVPQAMIFSLKPTRPFLISVEFCARSQSLAAKP